MLSVGIVGLPNSGKSTLFNALLSRQIAQVGEYPFTTIEPNTGVVEVPDKRLDRLAEIVKPERVVPAAIKFIDIAGLVRGAYRGEGLGNQFLAHIREVDVLVHVLRAFESSHIPHFYGKIDPREDAEVVNLELEMAEIKKPQIYVLNIDEKQLGKKQLTASNLKLEGEVIPICAKLEAELADLSSEEAREYLKEAGVEKSGLDQLIKVSFKRLGLITFFTIKGGKQVQAWPIKKGATVLEAAGLVHTDFAQNFIKAEVIAFEELTQVGSWREAAEKGKIRLEGRDYKVCDGEVIEFKTTKPRSGF